MHQGQSDLWHRHNETHSSVVDICVVYATNSEVAAPGVKLPTHLQTAVVDVAVV